MGANAFEGSGYGKGGNPGEPRPARKLRCYA